MKFHSPEELLSGFIELTIHQSLYHAKFNWTCYFWEIQHMHNLYVLLFIFIPTTLLHYLKHENVLL